MALKDMPVSDFPSGEIIEKQSFLLELSIWLKKTGPSLLERFEYFFAFISLLFYSDAVMMVIITGGASEGDGFDFGAANYTPAKLFYMFNYVVTTLLLLFRYKRTIYVLLSNPLLLATCIFINLSVFWSVAPSDTLSGVIALTFTTMFGIYMAGRFTLKQQITILGYVMLTITFLSMAFAIVLPHYGVMGGIHAGAWRGVFVHKNHAGQMMVLTCAVMLILFNHVKAHDRRRKWLYLSGLFFAFLMLIQTTSGGALLNSMFVMTIVMLTRIFRAEPRKLLLSLIFLSSAAVFITVAYGPLMSFTLGLIGKDPTLTGRTDIWKYIYTKIGESPELGYGFAGFWHGETGESGYVIQRVGWKVPDSHHGFLDMTLQIGIIGSSMVCLSLWQALLRGIARIRLFGSWISSWITVYTLLIVIINLSESSLLSSNSVLWILIIMTCFTASFEAKYLVDISRFDLMERRRIISEKIESEGGEPLKSSNLS